VTVAITADELESLFDTLPDVVFFVKAAASRFSTQTSRSYAGMASDAASK
jgi:hypothetical protein